MSNSIKILLAVAILVVVSAVGFVIYTYPHWWYQVGSVDARSPQGLAAPLTIYKSTRGELLLVISTDSLIDQYVFYPSRGEIGIPSRGQFEYFWFLAYSKDVPVPVVMSYDKIKVETYMNIVVDNGRLRFRARGNYQVEVDLNNF